MKAPLTDSQRSVAAIVYPARAMTGLRHVVVPADADATTMCEEDRALCGVNVDGWYMEHKDFDPKTIGCRRCRKAWDPVGEPVPSTRCVVCARPFWLDWGGAEPWRMCPHCLKALGTEGRVPKADSPLGRLIRAACARARASERRRLRK